MAGNLLKSPSGFRSQAPAAGLRRVMVGLPVQTIAAGATADLTTTVLEDFALERLVLSTSAQALGILNVKVGTKPLNVSSQPMAGNAFGEQAINNELSGYRAKSNAAITVTAVNNTGSGVQSGGGFFGWSAV